MRKKFWIRDSETTFIRQQINDLNLQNDTKLLDKAYDNIIMFK